MIRGLVSATYALTVAPTPRRARATWTSSCADAEPAGGRGSTAVTRTSAAGRARETAPQGHRSSPTLAGRLAGPGPLYGPLRPPASPTRTSVSAPTALTWTDLDQRAVDTARVLAMDAVERVGNGHPGTAMSLAPAAYLLFQRFIRHDPADPSWLGRDRFVLSCGHSSLTLYIQLYLSGYPLSLDDLRSFRTWGSQTPGHPEYGHTAGVETTTGPLGQGVATAVGMAMAARRERDLLDPEAPEGASPFDHLIWVLASDGDLQEGVSAEASSLAGHAGARQPGGHLGRQPHLDRGRHRDRLHRGHRRALRRVRLARAARGARRGRQRRRRGRWPRRSRPRGRRRPGRRSSRWRRSSPGPRRRCRTPASRTARRSGPTEVAATKEILGFDPAESFAVADDVLAHTRQVADRGAAAHAAWDADLAAWRTAQPERAALLDRLLARALPDGWTERPADVVPRRRPQGRRHPGGLGRRALGAGRRAARAVGRLRRPGGVQQHLDEGRRLVPAGRPAGPHRALRHPRARDGRGHERHRAARAAPGRTAAPSWSSPTTCAAPCGWPR